MLVNPEWVVKHGELESYWERIDTVVLRPIWPPPLVTDEAGPHLDRRTSYIHRLTVMKPGMMEEFVNLAIQIDAFERTIMAKHRARSLGCWVTYIGRSDISVCLSCYDDLSMRDAVAQELEVLPKFQDLYDRVAKC